MYICQKAREELRTYFRKWGDRKIKDLRILVSELSACSGSALPLLLIWEEYQKFSGKDFSAEIDSIKRFYEY